MAVMTHAQNQPTTGYALLTPTQQQAFDQAMAMADQAPNETTYQLAMATAARAAAMVLPASWDIARCDCFTNGCGCGAIFDTHTPGVVITATNNADYNLSRLQCPTCGHDHPQPAEG